MGSDRGESPSRRWLDCPSSFPSFSFTSFLFVGARTRRLAHSTPPCWRFCFVTDADCFAFLFFSYICLRDKRLVTRFNSFIHHTDVGSPANSAVPGPADASSGTTRSVEPSNIQQSSDFAAGGRQGWPNEKSSRCLRGDRSTLSWTRRSVLLIPYSQTSPRPTEHRTITPPQASSRLASLVNLPR